MVETNQAQGLDGVVSAVTSHVGPPHNYSAFKPAPVDSQPADVTRPAAASEAAAAAVQQAAVPQDDALTAEQVSISVSNTDCGLCLPGEAHVISGVTSKDPS